ncbi:choice-of-anchor D domain-containing protein [Micromonospora sp. CPCC 205711]|uniref:choice-of-anchor D domain-containing protein n=1 Tax=Micromonospora sp. CPCC 205547 TaxID=3122400 RepID=UPI002FEFBF8D
MGCPLRTFRTLLGGVVAGACVLAGLPGVALAAPTAPYTALTADLGEHHARPVLDSFVYDDTTATMRGAATADDTFQLTATFPDTSYQLRLDAAPPTGGTWTEGQTYATARGRDSTHALLDLIESGTGGCTEAVGAVTVREVVRDTGSQTMTGFAANYEYHCDGDPAAITGEIRWNSSVGYVAVLPEPRLLDFSGVYLGDSPTKSVVLQSVGSQATTFGSLTLGGTNPQSFQVDWDGCSGRTVQADSTCTILIRARPTRAGWHNAVLYLPDNSATGRRAIPLKAYGIDSNKGSYYPVTPTRLMDTRTGLGAPKAKLGPAGKINLQVGGRGGLPSAGIGAVVLNVTVTGPTAGSFLTVYPSTDSQRPTASSVNFAKGWLGSNNVTVKLGTDGKVAIYNNSGYTDVVVDVVGFYGDGVAVSSIPAKGGQYQPFEPYRILDTRDGTRGPLPAGAAVNGWIDFLDGDLNSHVRALVLNITAVSPQQGGFLTAWSGTTSVPEVSTVNYAAGKVVPNLAYVQTVPCAAGGCGGATGAPNYKIYTSATTHVVVDLVGVVDDGTVTDGLRFRPRSPTRIADSRIQQGLRDLGPGATGTVTVPSQLVDEATQVVAMNVTAVTPEKSTVLTVWPADLGIERPLASNLNPAAGQTVSNGVLAGIGPKDAFNVWNLTGWTGVVADVVGTFYVYPATAGTTASAAPARRTFAGTIGSERVSG